MKQLIPKDDFGIFADKSERVLVDSRFVAERFEKRHDNVLRDIQYITESKSGLSEEFTALNFEVSKYKDSTGRKLPCYLLTRDGFVMLVMGYTGKRAMQFKEAYIKRFNQMEAYLQTYISVRNEFPLITEQINLLHEKPKKYHFSNEFNMLYRIVTGTTASDIRKLHGLDDNAVVRPYLTHEEIALLDKLYKIDIGLLVSTPDYYERKEILQQCKDNYLSRHQLIGACV